MGFVSTAPQWELQNKFFWLLSFIVLNFSTFVVLCFFSFSNLLLFIVGILKDVLLLLMFLQAIPVQPRTGQLASGIIRSSPPPTEYLAEINKVLLSMDDVELSLNTPELSSVVYEDFSFQEDSLKVNTQALHLNSCN